MRPPMPPARRCGCSLLLAAALLLAGSGPLRAALLVLDAEAEGAPAPGVHLGASNPGPAAAGDVTPEVVYQRHRLEGEPVAIAPGAHHEWHFSLPLPEAPGSFPVTVRVRYEDADGRRITLPTVAVLQTPEASPSSVRASFTVGDIGRAGGGQVVLENAGQRPVAGRVFFVLPAGLTTEPESGPAPVAAGASASVPLVIENRGAAAGLYPLYAVFEYTADGMHHTVVARTLATASPSGHGRSVPLGVGLAALTGALVVLGMALRRARTR